MTKSSMKERMTTERCPLCGQPTCKSSIKIRDDKTGTQVLLITCENCGIFRLPYNVIEAVEDELRSAILSHGIWKRQSGELGPLLLSSAHDFIIENEKLPTPTEQCNNLILYCGEKRWNSPGEFLEDKYYCLIAKAGAQHENDIIYWLNTLKKTGLLESKRAADFNIANFNPYRLSGKGWERYELLRQGLADTHKAFMAMPFGDDEIRKVYECFKEAVSETGFELTNDLLENPEAGLIDDHLRVEVRRARFLIAELTDKNRGAYWEGGFAEGLGKKVIYSVRKDIHESKEWDEKVHFDTNHCVMVIWEKDKLNAAAEQLKNIIRNTFPADAIMY